MVNGMKIHTRNGDDGTTGLFYGGRVRKDSDHPSAYGDVDEAQAAIGWARSQVERGSEIDRVLIHVLRDLWVLMAELATLPENRDKLEDGVSLVTNTMVEDLEKYIDKTYEQHYSKSKFQATEFIIDAGHGEGFCIGNILKYAQRYGKKNGKNRADLLKVIHYAIIALNLNNGESDETE